jgi:DNA primase (bacterial type)
VFMRRRDRQKALEEFQSEDDGEQGVFPGFDVPRPKMDESELDDFIRAYHPYMKARGFTKKACKAWDIMIDHRDYGDMIVFPIRDIDGNLLAYSRRMTWDRPTCTWCGYSGKGQKWGLRPNKAGEGGCPSCGGFVWPKYLHSKGFQRNLYLYGEHMIDREHRKGVVVEGNLDPIRLWQCGVKNAVATLGANPGTNRPNPLKGIPGEQLYRLECLFDEIVLIADGDKAGYQWANQFEKYFSQRWVGIHTVHAPKDKDPGDMDREGFKRLIGQFDVWQ